MSSHGLIAHFFFVLKAYCLSFLAIINKASRKKKESVTMNPHALEILSSCPYLVLLNLMTLVQDYVLVREQNLMCPYRIP